MALAFSGNGHAWLPDLCILLALLEQLQVHDELDERD